MRTTCVIAAVLSLSLFGCTEHNPRAATKINQEASLSGDLSLNPLGGKVITSWIDSRNSTMSTLFGNDVATQYARTNSKHDYPSGSILSLVTWNQQEDDRWFGAKIPASVKSVEIVAVDNGRYSYKKYEGRPLRQILAQEDPTPNDRAAYLLSQRPAVMP
jgi:hypothetical protein